MNAFDTKDIRSLKVNSIQQDRRLQARIEDLKAPPTQKAAKAINKLTVESYAKSMKAGAVFPPVQVHMIGGVPYLVDGWHRLEATKKIGSKEIEAEVTHDSTWEEALQAAAVANLRHGLRLQTKKQRERAFDMFIEGKGHIKIPARGRRKLELMTKTDIAAQFGVGHQTVGRWIKQRHPDVHKLYMEGKEDFVLLPVADDAEAREKLVKENAIEALKGFADAAAQVPPGPNRSAIVMLAEEALAMLKQGVRWELPEAVQEDF